MSRPLGLVLSIQRYITINRIFVSYMQRIQTTFAFFQHTHWLKSQSDFFISDISLSVFVSDLSNLTSCFDFMRTFTHTLNVRYDRYDCQLVSVNY